jgi:hypothetical protein
MTVDAAWHTLDGLALPRPDRTRCRQCKCTNDYACEQALDSLQRANLLEVHPDDQILDWRNRRVRLTATGLLKRAELKVSEGLPRRWP